MSTTVLDELKQVNGWLELDNSQKKALYEQFCIVQKAKTNPEEFLAALNVENKNVNAESVRKASQVGVALPIATQLISMDKATSNVSGDKVDYKQIYDSITKPETEYTAQVKFGRGDTTTMFQLANNTGPNIASNMRSRLKVVKMVSVTDRMRQAAAEKAAALDTAREKKASRENVLEGLKKDVNAHCAVTKTARENVTGSAENSKKSMLSTLTGGFLGKGKPS